MERRMASRINLEFIYWINWVSTLREKRRNIRALGNLLAAIKKLLNLATVPFPKTAKRGEGEIRRGASLAADQFAAPPDIVLHPGRKQQVVGIALNLANMEGRRGNHIGHILFADLDHEVRGCHLPPELGLNDVTFKRSRHLLDSIHH